MNRLAKLLGLSGDEKELDLHELAPEGTETLVREVPVDDIHTNPFQPRRWFREEALAVYSCLFRPAFLCHPASYS